MTKIFYIFLILFSSLTFAQEQATEVVIGHVQTLKSDILDETRTIKVWLPENYATSTRAFPVFYLLDAEMEMRFAKAAATVAELGGSAMPEMIVVGVENVDRNRDMFPEEDGSRGGADKFLGFLTDELLPFVDSQYRTTHYRILTGHSNSALFVCYALLRQPESFNAYFAISPMLGHREKAMMALAKQSFASFPQRNTFLYIEYGGDDFGRVVDLVPEFVEILEQANPVALSHRVDVLPGEGHVPYSAYRDALVALFHDYRVEEESLTRGLGYIEKYYQNLSGRYGFKIEVPLEPMVEYGRLMLKQKDHELAIEAFKQVSVRYPDDATGYYWLGRAYEASNQLPEAVRSYRYFLKIYPQGGFIRSRISELEKSIAQ